MVLSCLCKLRNAGVIKLLQYLRALPYFKPKLFYIRIQKIIHKCFSFSKSHKDISLNNESDRGLVIIQKFNFHHLVFQLLKGMGAVGVIDYEILSVPFL